MAISWPKNMVLVDANILLRWLLGDHQQLSPKAEKIVQQSKLGNLLVTDIVVAEIVYVLRATGRDRAQVAEALLLIGRTAAFKYENQELVTEVTSLLADTNLDFAGCYLLARSRREKLGLATFDKQLGKR